MFDLLASYDASPEIAIVSAKIAGVEIAKFVDGLKISTTPPESRFERNSSVAFLLKPQNKLDYTRFMKLFKGGKKFNVTLRIKRDPGYRRHKMFTTYSLKAFLNAISFAPNTINDSFCDYIEVVSANGKIKRTTL